MTYPKYKNKHLEEALWGPKDSPKFDKNKASKLPKKYIIFYGDVVNRVLRKLKLKKSKIKLWGCDFYWFKDIGIIRMKGIGSPHAVAVFESLIALGGKEFLNIGFAGGLHKEGFFLCKKALRDEGTSYHYVSQGDFSYPDNKLTDKLGRTMMKMGIRYEDCISWTIDAPFRETKAEIEKYSKEGISTVEMETSALFAVATLRKVKIASAFVVSDVLRKDKWEYKYHKFNVKKSIDKLFDVAVETLR